jgi:hypothetical protein
LGANEAPIFGPQFQPVRDFNGRTPEFINP